MKKILLVSYDQNDAKLWCHENNFSQNLGNKVTSVNDSQSLRGLNYLLYDLVFTKRSPQRHDFEIIMQSLRIARFSEHVIQDALKNAA